MNIIRTNDLIKRYGTITALRGVTLEVPRGQIFGLLGQNGAGKTTLVKILLGLTQATAGDASLLDEPAGSAAVARQVGYLPEDHRFPDYHTGASLLDFYGTLLEMRRPQRRQRSAALLELVGLKERADWKIRTYSKGMKQRLGVAQALLQDPALLFLDEPTDGVDPVGRREIRDLMTRLRGEGKTVFVNSHLLSEVELVCDRVAILRKGEKVCEGTVEELTSRKGQFVLGLAPDEELPLEEIRRLGFEAEARVPHWLIRIPEGGSIDPVIDLLRSRGLGLRHLVEHRESLEELFLATVEEGKKEETVEAEKKPTGWRARRGNQS